MMVAKASIVMALLFSARSLCATGEVHDRGERVEGTLEWLRVADPAVDFASDLRNEDLHFIELTGQGPVLPYLGRMRQFMCYQAYAHTKVIDVGYCMIYGDDDVRRRQLAYAYGEAYNQLLVRHLDLSGLNDCAPEADWDAAWVAVNQTFDSGQGKKSGTAKLSRDSLRVYLNDFGWHERAARDACVLLQQHGLDRDFNVVISPRALINTAREDDILFTLKCGSKARSLTTGLSWRRAGGRRRTRCGARAPQLSRALAGFAFVVNMSKRFLILVAVALPGGLIAYSIVGMVAGQPRRFLIMVAALAIAMGFCAWLNRGSRVIGLICLTVAAIALLILVDEVSYLRWRDQVEHTVTVMKQGVNPGSRSLAANLPSGATQYWVEPGRVFALVFEPPALAWTYHLQHMSRPSNWLVGAVSGLVADNVLDRYSSDEAREMVLPHTPYVVGVMTCETIAACGERDKGTWIIYVDHGHSI